MAVNRMDKKYPDVERPYMKQIERHPRKICALGPTLLALVNHHKGRFMNNRFTKIALLICALSQVLSCVHVGPQAGGEPITLRVKLNEEIISVSLERYVASVLAGEVPASWPIEALKAQAVASRTYALRRYQERKARPFHLEATTMDQVYRKETKPVFVSATKATEAMVLMDGEQLCETSFHSTCGGKTASAKEVWGTSHTHLNGISCPYCKDSPTYKWQSKIAKSELEKKLNLNISSLSISKRYGDGRVRAFLINGKEDPSLNGHKLRMKVGPMLIKSAMISKISLKDSFVVFEGNGFGHGVGLCQFGSRKMAEDGSSFKDILKFYYPGTSLSRMPALA